MRVDDLLAEVEPLSHPDRCRRLAGLRRLSGDAELAGMLAELGDGGHYERGLALQIAAATRDAASLAAVVRAVQDPDAALATRAIGLAVRLGVGDEVFDELLTDAPSALRAATYAAIRRYRRRDLAERLIDGVADRWGPAEAAALLPACGTDAVRLRLEALAHAVPNWAAFGRAHPVPMLDFAEQALAGLPEGAREAWWQRHAPGVATVTKTDPSRVVRLLEVFWRHGPLPSALAPRVGLLLDAEPARMLRLLLAKEHRQALIGAVRRRAVQDRLVRLADDDLAAVARAVHEDGYALRSLLLGFPPSRRGPVFDAAMAGVDLTADELPDNLFDVLPAAVRIREARRMLGLRRVAESPEAVWRITSLLPYEEAEPVLRAVTRRPDAAERATGYEMLVRCAGRTRDPETLTRLLESLGRLRNEQDPVRRDVITALAELPRGMIEPVHGAALGRIVDDALAARDVSWGTRYGLVALAGNVFRQGTARGDTDLLVLALDSVAKLTGRFGPIELGDLGRELRPGQEHELVRALVPHLTESGRRDDHRLTLVVARALGRRGHEVPELQDALEAALGATSDEVIKAAVGHWLRPPRSRSERVGRVVAGDPSMVALHPVLAAIARQRTDLLDLVLSRPGPTGRFRRPDVAYVPDVEPSWTGRWTARQRAAHLETLRRLVRDEKVPVSDRARALATMARLPGADPALVREHLNSRDAFLRRAALTALPWVGSPQEALADLLDRAGSDDAHVALYAAGRAVRFVRPSSLTSALGPVLATGKITARKSALRLLLHGRAPGALDLVAAAWAEPGQHPDVRTAIVSVVHERMDDPRALRILTEAADGPRDLARQVAAAAPLQIAERFRTTYAELLLRVARSTDPQAQAAAVQRLTAWAPWAPDAPALLAALITDLDRTDLWRPALTALVGCAATGFGLAELAAATAALTTAPAEPDAGAERDRPAAQRLTALVTDVRAAAYADRDRLEPALLALDDRLPEPFAAELRAATLDWPTRAPAPGTDDELSAALEALAERPMGGTLAIRRVAMALATDDPDGFGFNPTPGSSDDTEPEHVLPYAVRLADRGDLAGGLFAAALAERHGPRAGWPPEWRALVRLLRAHREPDVAYTAQMIITAVE